MKKQSLIIWLFVLICSKPLTAACIDVCNEDGTNAVDIKIICPNNQTLTKTLQPHTNVWYKPRGECLQCKFGYKFADRNDYYWGMGPWCTDQCSIYNLWWGASIGSGGSPHNKCQFQQPSLWQVMLISFGSVIGAVLIVVGAYVLWHKCRQARMQRDNAPIPIGYPGPGAEVFN